MIFYEGHKVYMNGDYPAIWLNGQNQHIHRLQWVKHYGVIPSDYVIHHKDENKLNWDIENLELLPRCDHIKQHKKVVKRPGIRIVGIKDSQLMTFRSIEEAAKFCETHTSSIQRILHGKQKTANGWTFERM